MKFKAIGLLFLSVFCLASCSGNNESTPGASTSAPESSQTVRYFGNLTFLEQGQARIDLFNIDINISYGNQAITAPYTIVTLNDNANITGSQNTAHEDSYYVLTCFEKSSVIEQQVVDCAGGIEGDHILEYLEMLSNDLKGFERAYISICKGAPTWTHGLNARLDSDLEAESAQEQA